MSSDVMLSEAKHLGFVRGALDPNQSEILRFAQNDTTDWILEYTRKLAITPPIFLAAFV